MGTDSREAKSLDKYANMFSGVYTQGRIWIGSLAFYLPFLGKQNLPALITKGVGIDYHIIFGFILLGFEESSLL
jgi:hypothetical protein